MTKILLVAGVMALALTPVAGQAEGDPAKGKKVFNRCKVCHEVSTTKNKIGPNLKGVIGRKAAAADGYKYSPAMKKAGEGGLTWTVENIDQFITSPKKLVPGTKMPFAGLRKASDRADLIAYVKQASE